jgi:DNA-binding NarL/FixJ family response regulator
MRLAVEQDPPDLVITDLQVGNMGGMAICLDLHLEESGGRIPHVPIVILLDRRADVFLARRSASEGWLVKPLDAIRIRRAARAVLDGGTFHDESYRPLPLLADR